jgi:hydrogenase/urease accessory protein HupE
MKTFQLIVVFILTCLSTTQAFSHTFSTDYLILKQNDNSLSGHWLINILDIQNNINLDLNHDSKISWSELKKSREQINYFLLSESFSIASKAPCNTNIDEFQLKNKTEGTFLSLKVNIACSTIEKSLMVNATPFLAENPNHKTLLFISNKDKTQSFVFDQTHQSQTIDLARNNTFIQFFKEGMAHILEGFDHLLFLMTLFLPIIFHSKESLKNKTIKVIQLMTVFSIAHSITLGLSWSEWISLPARLTESIIALSVALAGISFFHKKFNDKILIITFLFGLIHGLGFASALTELSLKTSDFFLTLFSFNMGIEVGQLIVILIALPFFFFISQSQIGHRYVAPVLASFVTLCGTGWMIQRLMS